MATFNTKFSYEREESTAATVSIADIKIPALKYLVSSIQQSKNNSLKNDS